MKTETTYDTESIIKETSLYMALELSEKSWVLGFTIGYGQKPRLRVIDARDMEKLKQEIQFAKKRFNLLETAPVNSCYEAGREGFWLHRCLLSIGIKNIIVDSSSIEVNRRARRRKTDRIDARKLLTMLLRYYMGEHKVWSVVHVPSVMAEDGRQMHREIRTLKVERARHINRIKGLLVSQGVRMPIRKDFPKKIKKVLLWDSTPIPVGIRSRIEREYERMQFADQQIKELEKQRRAQIRHANDPVTDQIRQLVKLKGIGINSAWLFVKEFYAWRSFRNRREVGSLSGLTPTPHQSGYDSRERGISKAGNRFVRGMAIEIAWQWLRFQPDSKLTQWYQERFGHGSKRIRKIGIVALARRLLIALWQYLETGEVPEGAYLKEG